MCSHDGIERRVLLGARVLTAEERMSKYEWERQEEPRGEDRD